MNRARLLAAVLLFTPFPRLSAQQLGPMPELRKPAKALKAEPAASPAAPGAVAAAPAAVPAAAPAAADAPPAVVVTGGGSSPMLPAIPGAPTEERLQLDKITTVNGIKQQEYVGRVRAVTEERDETLLKNTLLAEKLRAEMIPMEHEHRKLQLRGQMEDEKAAQAVAALRWQRDKARLENDIAREKVVAEAIRLDADKLRFDADKLKKDAAVAELDFQSRKLRQESELADHKTVAIKADLELRGKKDELKKAVDRDPAYDPEPFKDGVLTITDRRIQLNGPILLGTAEFVNERIDYFNNKDPKLPIFLVIDRSPGGSVMEGYRIVKAIRESKAPVHVVVKSFAASMAAVITTLAPRSYAYPNAIILHHQILSFMFGNLTQQKEQLEVLKEWYKRLAEPVAKKSGYSLDAFTKEMYKRNSDGDWEEFADEAQRLKWVDHVVREVRETGTLKEPEDRRKKAIEEYYGGKEESDPTGNRFMRLPRLQPYDAYWIYNRDGYYR